MKDWFVTVIPPTFTEFWAGRISHGKRFILEGFKWEISPVSEKRGPRTWTPFPNMTRTPTPCGRLRLVVDVVGLYVLCPSHPMHSVRGIQRSENAVSNSMVNIWLFDPMEISAVHARSSWFSNDRACLFSKVEGVSTCTLSHALSLEGRRCNLLWRWDVLLWRLLR